MKFDVKNEINDFGLASGRYIVCNCIDELTGLFASTAIESDANAENLYHELIETIPKNEILSLVYCDLLQCLLDSKFAPEIGLKVAHEKLQLISEKSTDGYLGILRILLKCKSEVASKLLEDLSVNSTNTRVQTWANRIISSKNALQSDD